MTVFFTSDTHFDVGVDANAYVPIPAEALVHAADVYADQMDKLRMLIEARA